ncbi:MAG: hypothetical protein L6R42_009290, partial [Xanthoria sp. 1 TBL-2021]
MLSTIGIPYEILDHVLGYLDQGDVLSLSQTSHQFRSEELLRKSIYEDLINPRDVPLQSNARKYEQWRSRIEYLFKGLNPQTGPFVKRMAIPDHMTYEKLVKILQHCTNLEHVDFTGVED